MRVDEKPTKDIEDETVFMADFGNAEPMPPAAVKVVKSEALVAGKSFEISGITRIGRGSDNGDHTSIIRSYRYQLDSLLGIVSSANQTAPGHSTVG